MRKIILIAIALMLVPNEVSASPKGNLFSCTVEDVQKLQDTGALGRDGYTKLVRTTFKSIIYDEATGVLRHGSSGVSWQMKVVQKGTKENSSIGLREYHGRAASGADIIRIQTFIKEMPFMYVFGSEIHTGNCKRF